MVCLQYKPKSTYLLLLASQLLLFQAHALSCELFRQDRRVAVGQLISEDTGKKMLRLLCIRVHGPGQLLSTVGFVKNVVRQRLEVSQVRAVVISGISSGISGMK